MGHRGQLDKLDHCFQLQLEAEDLLSESLKGGSYGFSHCRSIAKVGINLPYVGFEGEELGGFCFCGEGKLPLRLLLAVALPR